MAASSNASPPDCSTSLCYVAVGVDRHAENDVAMLSLGQRRRRVDRVDVGDDDRATTAGAGVASGACAMAVDATVPRPIAATSEQGREGERGEHVAAGSSVS